MKKLTCLLLMLIISTGIIAGCSSPEEEEKPQPVLSEVGAALEGVMTLPETMELTAAEATDYLGTAEADIAELYVRIAEESIKSDLICLFKATDEAAAERIKTAVESYLHLQANSFKSYLPEEYAKVNGTEVGISGVYVYCAVSDNKAEVKAVFDKYFG